MSTATQSWYSHGIKCAHCKGYHSDIQGVRACASGTRRTPEYTRPEPVTQPPASVPVAPPAQSAPKVNSWFNELDVPPGRYAVYNKENILKFYVVKENTHPRYKRFRTVLAQASDELHLIRDVAVKRAILEKILLTGLETATLRYGLELGVCGVCGRTLTDQESRDRGVGPVCAEKKGWF